MRAEHAGRGSCKAAPRAGPAPLRRVCPMRTHTYTDLWPTAEQEALRGKCLSVCLASLRTVSFAESKCRPVYTHLWGSRAGPRCFSAFHKCSRSQMHGHCRGRSPRSQAPGRFWVWPWHSPAVSPSPAALPARRAQARSHTGQTAPEPRPNPERPQVLPHLGQVHLPGPCTDGASPRAQTLSTRERPRAVRHGGARETGTQSWCGTAQHGTARHGTARLVYCRPAPARSRCGRAPLWRRREAQAAAGPVPRRGPGRSGSGGRYGVSAAGAAAFLSCPDTGTYGANCIRELIRPTTNWWNASKAKVTTKRPGIVSSPPRPVPWLRGHWVSMRERDNAMKKKITLVAGHHTTGHQGSSNGEMLPLTHRMALLSHGFSFVWVSSLHGFKGLASHSAWESPLREGNGDCSGGFFFFLFQGWQFSARNQI